LPGHPSVKAHVERLIPAAQRADWYARRVGVAAARENNMIPAVRHSTRRSIVRAAGISTAEASGAEGFCLVRGQRLPLVRLHLKIKGVNGTASAEVPLVSFNEDAFTSYGKEQGFNAPTSEAAAFRYGAALKALLTRDGRNRLQIATRPWRRPTRSNRLARTKVPRTAASLSGREHAARSCGLGAGSMSGAPPTWRPRWIASVYLEIEGGLAGAADLRRECRDVGWDRASALGRTSLPGLPVNGAAICF
jgi:hypothetical protein